MSEEIFSTRSRKERPQMPVDVSLLKKDLDAIRAQRAKSKTPMTTHMGDEAQPIERIPMLSPTIMRVTTGGIPLGKFVRFFGSPSTGKSHLCYLVIAAAQKYRSERFPAGLVGCYWDTEGAWDVGHAEHLGVDTTKVILGESQVIERIAEEIEVLMRSAHVHVIDSLSDAKGLEELSSDLGDANIGIHSKAWKAALRRIENRMDRDENTVVMVSHVGTKIDLQKRTSYTYPKDGDHAQYVSSMNLEFTEGPWLFYHPDGHLEKSDKIKEEVGLSPAGIMEPDGKEITVRCRKNKTGRQGLSGKMRFDLNTFEFDTAFELADGGLYFDEEGKPASRSGKPAIISPTKGSWYQLPDGRKMNGRAGIRAEIDTNPELERLIRQAMMGGF